MGGGVGCGVWVGGEVSGRWRGAGCRGRKWCARGWVRARGAECRWRGEERGVGEGRSAGCGAGAGDAGRGGVTVAARGLAGLWDMASRDRGKQSMACLGRTQCGAVPLPRGSADPSPNYALSPHTPFPVLGCPPGRAHPPTCLRGPLWERRRRPRRGVGPGRMQFATKNKTLAHLSPHPNSSCRLSPALPPPAICGPAQPTPGAETVAGIKYQFPAHSPRTCTYSGGNPVALAVSCTSRVPTSAM